MILIRHLEEQFKSLFENVSKIEAQRNLRLERQTRKIKSLLGMVRAELSLPNATPSVAAQS